MTAAGIGAAARATPDAIALIGTSGTLTFAQLDRRQRLLAGALRARGLEAGDRIAVIAQNGLPMVEVLTGALRAAIVPVPIDPAVSEREAAFLVEDSGARWVFTSERFDGIPHVERVVTFGDAYERMLHESKAAPLADVTLTRPLHYTSGSTARPKGVWVAPLPASEATRWATAFAEEWAITHEDTHLVCSPLSHSAPARFAIRTLETGGRVVLRRKFDAAETLAAIELFGISTTFVVPSHLTRIFALDDRALRRHDVTGLRLVVHAGEAIAHDLKRRAIAFFPPGSLWEFYGATEGQATRISSEEWLRKPGSVGRARRDVDLFIGDPSAPDRRLPRNAAGLVWIKDRAAPPFEYWQDPDTTRRRRLGDAFTVGDLGRLDDDGYLFLEGRTDDVIVTGGVNVAPAEVEAALAEHPAVAEVLVYGHPSEEWGHEVRALVVPAYGLPLDADHLWEWARARLSGVKCPKQIDLVEALPRTAAGKLRRRLDPPVSGLSN